MFEDITEKFKQIKESGYNIKVQNYSNKVLLALVEFDTYEELITRYHEIKHFVAGEVQTRFLELDLKNELLWNFYLIIIIHEEKTEKNYKNDIQKIENDEYAYKKYVINLTNENNLSIELSKRIPYFLDVEKIFNESSFKDYRNNLNTPPDIEKYINGKGIEIEDFINLKVDLNLMKSIYRGDYNEN